MPNAESRYEILCKIASCCAVSDDTGSVYRNVLSLVDECIPGSDPALLFSDGARIGSASSLDLCVYTEKAALHSEVPTLIKAPGASLWTVPILVDSSRRGSLMARAEGLSDGDKSFLQAAAHNIKLFLAARKVAPADSVATNKRVQEISAIYEISQAFDNVSIDGLLELITEKAAAVMDAQACSLLLKVREKDELVIKASFGLSPEIIEETRVAYGQGVAGTVAKTGRPMLLNNLKDDPRFRDSNVTPRPDIVSSISVPLRDEEGRVQGVLNIRRTSPAAMFNQDDLKVFSVFASQAALAISNAQLYSSLKARVSELSMLYQAGRDLSAAYNIEGAAQVLVHFAASVGNENPVMLLLWDGRKGARIPASHGISDEFRANVERSADEQAVAWMRNLRDPRRWLLSNADRRPSSVRSLASTLAGELDWVSIVPLVAEDAVVGTLILGSKRSGNLDQRRVRILSIVASQAAVVIKNARSHEEQMDRRVLELSALYNLSERISSAATLREAWDVILEIVQDIVVCDESFMCTVDPENEMIAVQVSHGEKYSQLCDASFGLCDDALVRWTVENRKAFISPDIKKDRRFGKSTMRDSQVRSVMAIPLILHDQVVGVLNVHGFSRGLYTDENVRVLSVIATQAAALYKEQEALNSLMNYTDNILRSIAVGVITLDRDGKALTWNKAAEEILGMTSDEAVGNDYSSIIQEFYITDDEKSMLIGDIGRVMETGESYVGYKREFNPTGMPSIYANVNISRMVNNSGDGVGIVIIFENVAAQVQMERDLHRVSELAAIGQLAANIAHEIRNPLSSIKGAAQFLRGDDTEQAFGSEFLDIIIEEVNVLNKITTEFLDYARPSSLSLTEIDINEVVARTLQLLQMDISTHGIGIEQHLDERLSTIMADHRQLDQVFLNVIINALQAMPDGGQLIVSTRVARNGVSVTVEDTGVGIPSGQLENIFQPFFTTKTKGTGLGLAIVEKIIDNHGGKITVESKPGHGTKFTMYLPIRCGKADDDSVFTVSETAVGEVDLFQRAHGG